jgi:hypothetical protein
MNYEQRIEQLQEKEKIEYENSSFIIYVSMYDTIKDLSDEDRLLAYDMLMELGINNKLYKTGNIIVDKIISAIEPSITMAQNKYKSKIQGFNKGIY